MSSRLHETTRRAAQAKIFDLAADAFRTPSREWIEAAAIILRGESLTPEFLQGFIAAVRSRPGQTETELWADRAALAAFADGYERALLDNIEAFRAEAAEITQRALTEIEAHAKRLISEAVANPGGDRHVAARPTIN